MHGITPEQLKTLIGMLPFLIPLAVIELALMVIALVNLFKREGMSNNTKLVWVLVIVIINFFGPIAYLLFGRKDKPVDSD